MCAFVRESPPPELQKPRLLDRVRDEIRKRHYSRRTEKTYVGWIRRFILFHGKRHPAEMGKVEMSTTMVYTHVLNRGGRGVLSPLDER
jgi:hypothetical protein